jgi:integrase
VARGNICKRGRNSWRIKIERASESPGGKPRVHTETIKGRRQDAERKLTESLGQIDTGKLIESDKTTVEEHIVAWLGRTPEKGKEPPPPPSGISPKTAERYRELAESYIFPRLGHVPLQKLRPAQVAEWQEKLLKSGGAKGRPLSAQTVNHARRVLHRALERAMAAEVVGRNVLGIIDAPKIEPKVDDNGAIRGIEILSAGQIAEALEKLAGHHLHTIAHIAIATGMRRGELLALDWASVDLDAGRVTVKRSLEETRAGLRFKPTKNRKARALVLDADAMAVLRAHRKAQLEQRMALGLGRPPADALVFCQADGQPLVPSWLSYSWRNAVASLKLPKVSFHSLRHTHASALIDAGLNVEVVSRRLCHSSAAITLKVYVHAFDRTKSDAAAADAIAAAMRGGAK